MIYINRHDVKTRDIETVDEFETRIEAFKMVQEYQRSDHSGFYEISTKPTKDWNNE